MTKLDIHNMQGEVVGEFTLDDSIFAVEPDENLVHLVLVAQLANARQGTAKTKDRSEVRGGGRKPWRQKGTGRARHGSSRSPIWVGGGVTFGPAPRSYKQKVNRKEKRKALKSVLSSKLQNKQIILVDELEFAKPKTKEFAQVLQNLGVENSALIAVEPDNTNARLSARNLANVRTISSETLNVYDLLRYDNFVMTKAQCEKIQEVYV